MKDEGDDGVGVGVRKEGSKSWSPHITKASVTLQTKPRIGHILPFVP